MPQDQHTPPADPGQPSTAELIERLRLVLDRETADLLTNTGDALLVPDVHAVHRIASLAGAFVALGGAQLDAGDTVPAEEYAALAAELATEREAYGELGRIHADVKRKARDLLAAAFGDVVVCTILREGGRFEDLVRELDRLEQEVGRHEAPR